MRIIKQELGSLSDGKLIKTIYIKFEPEDKEDERIIKEQGDSFYY